MGLDRWNQIDPVQQIRFFKTPGLPHMGKARCYKETAVPTATFQFNRANTRVEYLYENIRLYLRVLRIGFMKSPNRRRKEARGGPNAPSAASF
jgi:hypothetical protein